MSASIISFLNKDVAFDDAAIRVMGEAYDKALAALHDQGQPTVVREALARRIIEIAKMGERDPDKIYKRALAAFGLGRDLL
jgi:hypothetical protein